MLSSLASCRRTLLWSAGLLAAAAILILAGAIPLVLADTFELSAPERAATALGVVAGAGLVVAGLIALVATRGGAERPSREGLWPLAILALVKGLLLLDAGFAFAGHGPALRGAVVLVFLASAMDVVAAVLVGASAVALRRAWPSDPGPLTPHSAS